MLDLTRDFKLLEDHCDKLIAPDVEDVSDWMAKQFGPWRAAPLENNECPHVAQFARADVGRITLGTVRWGVGVRTETPGGDEVLVTQLPVAGSVKMCIDGFDAVEVDADQARIYKRNVAQTSTVSSDYATIGLIVPLNLIEQRAQSYYGGLPDDTVTFSPTLKLQTPAGANLAYLARYLIRNRVAQPYITENPLLMATLTDLVVGQLLLNLSHSQSEAKHVCSIGAVPRVIQRADEYMHAYAKQPITIEDLAHAAGCSERSLQKAYRQFRSTTPILALRSVRLQEAQRDLQANEMSVTQVALKWGFSNPGRFADAYQKQFGEKPSETRVLRSANSNLILPN